MFFVFKSQCLKNDAKIRDLLDSRERADSNKAVGKNQSDTSTIAPQFVDNATTSYVGYLEQSTNHEHSPEPKTEPRVQYLFCEADNDGYEVARDSPTRDSPTDSTPSPSDEKCVYIKQEIGDDDGQTARAVNQKPSSSKKKTAVVKSELIAAKLGKGRPLKYNKSVKTPETSDVVSTCSACNQTFKKQTLLDKHFNICLARDLSCQFCGQNFKSQKLLDKHVHSKHTERNDYLCYFCGLVFNNSYKLLTHIRTHMPLDKVFNCDKCSKCFRKRQAMINHIRSAHSENTYMCTLCGSQLSSLPGLKLHVRTIHTHRKVDRVLKCPLCPKMFARQQYVVRHMRSHTGETPYNCKYCDRSFTLRWNHIQHERLHTGEKRYKCEICQKCFTHNVSKKNHMKYHKDVPGVNYVAPVKRKKSETNT